MVVVYFDQYGYQAKGMDIDSSLGEKQIEELIEFKYPDWVFFDIV